MCVYNVIMEVTRLHDNLSKNSLIHINSYNYLLHGSSKPISAHIKSFIFYIKIPVVTFENNEVK